MKNGFGYIALIILSNEYLDERTICYFGRSRRRRPMSEESAEDENKTDAKESVDESEKNVVKRKKPKVSGKEVMNTETENVEDEVAQVAVELR